MGLINQTLQEFAGNLASGAPTPGGGSASAYAGALGVSLYIMVLEVERAKAEDPARLDKLVHELLPLKQRLLELVNLDTEAFDAVMKAFKLPKETEDEKAIRRAAIQAAMVHAADVPLETMGTALKALAMGETVVENGAKTAASDVGVGTLMLTAAITGAGYNVAINLPSIKDEAIKARLAEEKADIDSKAGSARNLINEKLKTLGI
jgi:formiminotetrahydrofolate cyclodeaminase